MAKTIEKYPIEVGTVAYVRITDEPVFILGIENGKVEVRRHSKTGSAEHYVKDHFDAGELASHEDWVLMQLENTMFEATHRAKYARRFESLSQKEGPRGASVGQADGEPYLN